MMSEHIAICFKCDRFRAADGVCERTGEHAVSRIGRGRVCPIGKHTIGQAMHWISGAMSLVKGKMGLVKQSKMKRRRLAACATCDRLNGRNCDACGCNVDFKAADDAQDCPLGKWPHRR